MRLTPLTSFIFTAISLFGQEAASPVQEPVKSPPPIQNLLDAFGRDTTFPPYSVVRVPLKIVAPPQVTLVNTSAEDGGENKVDVGAPNKAEGDKVNKAEGSSTDQTQANVTNNIDGGTASEEANTKEEIETLIKGKIEGGTQDGKQYELQCIATDCSFTLYEKNKAGQSTFEKIGRNIFVFVDIQGKGVIDVKNLTEKTDKTIFVQMTYLGSDDAGEGSQTITTNCFVGPQSMLVRHGLEVRREIVEGIGKCEAAKPSDQMLVKTLMAINDEILDLPENWTVGAYTTLSAVQDRRPDKKLENPETIQQAAASAGEYLTKRKSYLADVVKFLGKKLHLSKPTLEVFAFH